MTGQPDEAAASWLFVPGDRPDRFGRAARSGADEVICDLEDSVAEDGKDQARRQVAQWLAQDGSAWVRVNASSTPHYDVEERSAKTVGVVVAQKPGDREPPLILRTVSRLQARCSG